MSTAVVPPKHNYYHLVSLLPHLPNEIIFNYLPRSYLPSVLQQDSYFMSPWNPLHKHTATKYYQLENNYLSGDYTVLDYKVLDYCKKIAEDTIGTISTTSWYIYCIIDYEDNRIIHYDEYLTKPDKSSHKHIKTVSLTYVDNNTSAEHTCFRRQSFGKTFKTLNSSLHGNYKISYPDGKLHFHCLYKHDKKHGKCEEWHPDGRLAKRCFYNQGQLHGKFQMWYSSGELSIECAYRQGALYGEYSKWLPNGQIVTHCSYTRGR